MNMIVKFTMPICKKWFKFKCKIFELKFEDYGEKSVHLECKHMHVGRHYSMFTNQVSVGNELWFPSEYIEAVDIFDWN